MQIGLIAGAGKLPQIVAEDAKERGYKIIIVALEHLAGTELSQLADVIKWINVGKFGDIIDTLKFYDVKQTIMAGKVPKSLLYKSKMVPDLRTMKLLFSLKDRTDDAILNAVTKELEKEGIHLIDTATFSPHLLTPEGLLTRRPPTKDEMTDIEFGWMIAKAIGKLDIGQTVVIKEKAVMSVEAIEGTDEAILRGGKWAGNGAVVVKVSRPHQDMRLDVPVAGETTLNAMIKVNARVLAIEAHRSMIINREMVTKEADKAGITIIGYRKNS
ncbi:MAG: LpxI family protein [Dissulfurispiraceae bacterium]